MDIHKPKPFHGWREFLKEYGIIVLGVLTALGAEQVVEQLHWRHVTAEARQAVAADQRRLVDLIGAQDAMSPCIRDELARIEKVLDQAERDGRLPSEVPMIVVPIQAPWSMRGWQGIVSGQALAHLSAGETADFTAQAIRVEDMLHSAVEQIDDWSQLRALRTPGRKLSEAEAANLRSVLARAWSRAARTRRNADQIGQMIAKDGMLSKAEIEAAWRHGQAIGAGFDICTGRSGAPATGLDIPSLSAPAAPPAAS